MGPDGIISIINALEYNQTLVQLYLRGNGSVSTDARIVECLEQNETILELLVDVSTFPFFLFSFLFYILAMPVFITSIQVDMDLQTKIENLIQRNMTHSRESRFKKIKLANQ